MASKRKTLCIDQIVTLIRAIEKDEKKAETKRSSCKRIRKPKFEDLGQAMLTWFHKQRCNNLSISGPILKTKAELLLNNLHRHNIIYGKISGEALNVDLNVTNSRLINVWPKLNENYTPDDIFNADKIEIDENLVTTTSLTDGEILNAVTKDEEEQKKDEEEVQLDEVIIPSIQQALDVAKLLEKFLLFHEDEPKLSQSMGKIHRKIQKQYWQNKKVQT
ncbi:tigger transposable element-derived protein 4-like [Aphis craccivora]|uniref:Tigger transposable element-derived protein 4-like n=1 Tax=Aphis craccivora TaxID=307492 RepID=A0A6G0ZNL7_APHCR|nr:tigger transposable element-derived protein 4-like [Aphis craccivora]